MGKIADIKILAWLFSCNQPASNSKVISECPSVGCLRTICIPIYGEIHLKNINPNLQGQNLLQNVALFTPYVVKIVCCVRLFPNFDFTCDRIAM